MPQHLTKKDKSGITTSFDYLSMLDLFLSILSSSLGNVDDPQLIYDLIDQIEEVQEILPDDPYLSKEEIKELTDKDLCWVIAVIDGDTIYVSCDEGDRDVFQVRLLATDTAEVNGLDSSEECFGTESTTYVTNFLKNRAITLRADEANEDEDPFGRKLRYVDVLQPDGTWLNLNKALVEHGFAQFPSQYPISYTGLFVSLEKQAQKEGRGMWGACEASEIDMF